MKTFRELNEENLNEEVSKSASKFIKLFNEQSKLLKEDIKMSSKNQDWYERIKAISALIEKTLKMKSFDGSSA